MRRRSSTGGKSVKTRRRKAMTLKRGIAPDPRPVAVPPLPARKQSSCSSPASWNQALDQHAATAATAGKRRAGTVALVRSSDLRGSQSEETALATSIHPMNMEGRCNEQLIQP